MNNHYTMHRVFQRTIFQAKIHIININVKQTPKIYNNSVTHTKPKKIMYI